MTVDDGGPCSFMAAETIRTRRSASLHMICFRVKPAFPIGMKVASQKQALLTPWLWGINGSTSVCASVIAVVIGLNWGITTTFWTGFMCYAIAFISFLAATRKRAPSGTSF